jgi:ABC-type amino acid transport substrate-binding protein
MKKLFVLLLISLLPFATFAADKNETAYERVMRTNTLRCGYISWPPYVEKDIKTGKMSGMNVDFANKVAENLNIKIDWALEVTPGQQVEALKAGKIDVMCGAEGPMYPNTVRFLQYSIPFTYVPFFFYVRADDHRFDKDWRAMNDPSVRMVTIDGDFSGFVVGAQLPKATRHDMPQLGAPGQMMLDVAGSKADVLINDELSIADYMKNNPDKLKRLQTAEPIAVAANTFSALRGPEGNDLIGLLNQTIELMRSYKMDRTILQPYIDKAPESFYYSAPPWKAQK